MWWGWLIGAQELVEYISPQLRLQRLRLVGVLHPHKLVFVTIQASFLQIWLLYIY